jgi:TnpA family transposase
MATMLNDAKDQKLWPPQMKKLFMDLMVEECIKGNMQDGIYKNTWKKMVTEHYVRTKRSFNPKQVKTKFNRLQTKFNVQNTCITHLLNINIDVHNCLMV